MLVEDWKLAVDRKELVTVLSTDMSKAFDSLCHPLTIKKLEAYGFGSNSLKLIRSFFSDRFNRVKLNQNTSEWKCMRRGCPQGTAFGPLLWNLFQNNMSFHVKESDLTMYADDHQMYTTGKSYGVVEARLMMQGQLFLTWYRDNFLHANPQKFQSFTINPRNVDVENKVMVLKLMTRKLIKPNKLCY